MKKPKPIAVDALRQVEWEEVDSSHLIGFGARSSPRIPQSDVRLEGHDITNRLENARSDRPGRPGTA
jgi:hypothetical protein